MSRRFITADADTDLPEPLSPRMASVSPRPTDHDTFLTASTVPRAVWKLTDRFLTVSTASDICAPRAFEPPALVGIERDPHPAREQVERKRCDHDHEAG